MFIDRQISTFGTVFILGIHPKSLLVSGTIASLGLRSGINSRVPLAKLLELPEEIEHLFWHKKHTCHLSICSIIFGLPLLHKLHSEVQVFLPLGHHLSYSSLSSIQLIAHAIAARNNAMEINLIFRHYPQGPFLKLRKHFPNVLDDSPFILVCEDWPVITVLWIRELLSGEFS